MLSTTRLPARSVFVTSDKSSLTRVKAGTGELLVGSEPLVFTGLPPSLMVVMYAVSHRGVRSGKRVLNLTVPAQARARADLCPRMRAHYRNIFGGSYVVGASNSERWLQLRRPVPHSAAPCSTTHAISHTRSTNPHPVAHIGGNARSAPTASPCMSGCNIHQSATTR